MTTSIPWQQSLIQSIEAELAVEHAKLSVLPTSELTWVTDQIKAILHDQSQCSYEVEYRRWYRFSIDFRTEKRLTPQNYRYALGFLVDFAVPRMTIMEGLKHKGGAWLADGLEPLEQFHTCMRDICLYPITHLDPKKYWECWKPNFGYQNITWHDVFTDTITRARSMGFWLSRVNVPNQLPQDAVDIIVAHLVPTLLSNMTMTPATQRYVF